MSKKKTKTETVSNTATNSNYANTNNFDWKTAPDTEDTAAYRAYRPQIDPGISHQYANQRNKLASSFNNPLGGYGTAQTQDAQLRTGMRNLGQDEAQAFRQGYGDVNNQRGGQLATLSALTRPQLVNTGSSGNASGTSSGTGTNTTTQSGGLLGDILMAGIGAGGTAAGGYLG